MFVPHLFRFGKLHGHARLGDLGNHTLTIKRALIKLLVPVASHSTTTHSLSPITMSVGRPPLPPFTEASAVEKVRLAEDGWNSRDPEKVSKAYTLDTKWRNRTDFVTNRAEAESFLQRKWDRELDYRLIKELWAFKDNRIAVRYAYEWRDDSGNWFRSYGNENWEFDATGLMERRFTSINDLPIKESERKYRWPLGRRPDNHPGLSELDL
eukprot:m.267285 g.267285  ORF g.267285 m.267285 type:complete len:210 (+) comp72169_c0_seq1:92-721(+)